ncbi:MAG: hypothetical protein JRD89_02725 [Deltaproteobacteria bacterium]|nr:hypothetical protein [Deltaproteobacteria bacterium]
MPVVVDKNSLPALKKELDYLRRNRLEIGIFEGSPSADSPSGDVEGLGEYSWDVVKIATIHEFGGKYIPERSFIRSTMDERESDITNMTERLLNQMIQGYLDAETLLSRLGEYITGLIKQKITDIRTPPNAPATIQRKGSSNPLIDTGRMRMSVTWRVVPVGGGT